MPIREYQREDGSTFEVIQKMSDAELTVCPETGQKVTRLLSPSAFHLKGSGWYKTDYTGSKSSSNGASTKSEAKEASGGGSADSSAAPSCNGQGPGSCGACAAD